MWECHQGCLRIRQLQCHSIDRSKISLSLDLCPDLTLYDPTHNKIWTGLTMIQMRTCTIWVLSVSVLCILLFSCGGKQMQLQYNNAIYVGVIQRRGGNEGEGVKAENFSFLPLHMLSHHFMFPIGRLVDVGCSSSYTEMIILWKSLSLFQSAAV